MENAKEINKENTFAQCVDILLTAVTLRDSCSAHPTCCLQTKQQPSPVDMEHIELHCCFPFISPSPSPIYKAIQKQAIL
jgi:hypothetical protein